MLGISDVTIIADISFCALVFVVVVILSICSKKKKDMHVTSMNAASIKCRMIASCIDITRLCVFIIIECLVLYIVDVVILREDIYDYPFYNSVLRTCIGFSFCILLPIAIAAYQNTNSMQTYGKRRENIRVIRIDGTLPS